MRKKCYLTIKSQKISFRVFLVLVKMVLYRKIASSWFFNHLFLTLLPTGEGGGGAFWPAPSDWQLELQNPFT